MYVYVAVYVLACITALLTEEVGANIVSKANGDT